MVHLQRHHKIDIKSSTKPVGNQVDGNNNHDKKAATLVGQVGGGDVEQSSALKTNPWTLCAKKLPVARNNQITNAILEYIIHDLRPYSTIESKVFRNMLSVLEPRYQPPNRQKISDYLIPALYENQKSVLFAELQTAEAVSLTTDAWTSRATESFLTITCHYVDKNWMMHSKVLQTEHFHGSHTGENVGHELTNCMINWGIKDKVSIITSDNASNMTVAIEVAGVQKLGCLAHTLNLASNKALSLPLLQRVLAKVRSVVTFFHKSNIATEVLQEKQLALQLPKHKLINDCKTRWNSTFQMLERFLKQRPAVLAALLDARIKKNDKARTVSGLTDQEIQCCEEFVSIMGVMLTATLILCEEKTPTSGLILPLLDKLLKHYERKEGDSVFVISLKNAVRQNLELRYKDPDLLMFLEESSALDPRTKNKPCVEDRAWERLIEKLSVIDFDLAVRSIKTESGELGDPVPCPTFPQHPVAAAIQDLPDLPQMHAVDADVEDSEVIDEHNICNKEMFEPKQKVARTALEVLFEDDIEITGEEVLTSNEMAIKEVNGYKARKAAPMKEDPLKWWQQNSIFFPRLAKLAARYFCVQATSVASERVFSTTGDIVCATRACLSPENVNALVFLKKNMS